MACAPSEDSEQPGHPPSLIRVFAVRLKKASVLSYPLSAQRKIWSDWADAQVDLSLRWAHIRRGSFLIWILERKQIVWVVMIWSSRYGLSFILFYFIYLFIFYFLSVVSFRWQCPDNERKDKSINYLFSGSDAVVQLLVLYTNGNLFDPPLPSLSDQTIGPFKTGLIVSESLNLCTHISLTHLRWWVAWSSGLFTGLHAVGPGSMTRADRFFRPIWQGSPNPVCTVLVKRCVGMTAGGDINCFWTSAVACIRLIKLARRSQTYITCFAVVPQWVILCVQREA